VRVLYYALGGGHGHALRGLAVLSRLAAGDPSRRARASIDAALIAPAAFSPWARALGVPHLAPPEADLSGWVERLAAPDLLLVDVFPRGVTADLLPMLGRAPAWLVSRRVRPDYYLHRDVRGAIEAHFERVLWTEAPAEPLRALRVPQLDLPSVLLGAPPLPRAEARRRLGVPYDHPLVLGIGSGDPEQQARLCRLLGKIAARAGTSLRFVSAELAAGALPGGEVARGATARSSPAVRDATVVRAFPAATLLPAADAVVSAAGYHAFHEATAQGAPAVFVPQRRRFDDQAWRARDALVATDPPGLEAAVRRLLREGWRRPRPVGEGAALLARLVERRVQAGVVPEEEIAALA
jgi:hypothetical protein